MKTLQYVKMITHFCITYFVRFMFFLMLVLSMKTFIWGRTSRRHFYEKKWAIISEYIKGSEVATFITTMLSLRDCRSIGWFP